MVVTDDPSDGQRGAEAFEQGDEAFDAESITDPNFLEEVERDPSLDPALQLDTRELEEIDGELDDPEAMVTLSGDFDDPDGLGEKPTRSIERDADEGGWDLDAPLTTSGVVADEVIEPKERDLIDGGAPAG
jgi:hypothetical protein